jgi:hypothetical protein
VTEKEIVHVRNQGSAAAPGGEVAGTEVRHGQDASALCDDRRLADLKGSLVFRQVADGLAVGADKGDLAGRDVALPTNGEDSPSKGFAHEDVKAADLLG